MNKKTVKFILDTIKSVADRPGAYGVQFESHGHISGASHLYFSDGFVCVRLEVCGDYCPVPINDDLWVTGEEMKEWYSKAKASDVFIPTKSDREHVDLVKVWNGFIESFEETEQSAIDCETFKKLAPLRVGLMTTGKTRAGDAVFFEGKKNKWSAIACGMTEQWKKNI